MPDINFGEWMIIALIALIVVGPRNLPDLSRKLGGWMREARAMATDFRVGLEREIAELDEVRSDLKNLGSEVAKPLTEIKDELGSVPGELKPLDWTGPVPPSGPTPADSARDFNRIHGIANGPDEPETPGISPKRAAKNEAERNNVDDGPAAATHASSDAVPSAQSGAATNAPASAVTDAGTDAASDSDRSGEV